MKVSEKFAVAEIDPIVAFPGIMYPGDTYEGVVITTVGAAIPKSRAKRRVATSIKRGFMCVAK